MISKQAMDKLNYSLPMKFVPEEIWNFMLSIAESVAQSICEQWNHMNSQTIHKLKLQFIIAKWFAQSFAGWRFQPLCKILVDQPTMC